MKISIITSTFNAAIDILKTIESIRSQSSKNIQWIVIDGASSDNTIEILNGNLDIVDCLISEPDSGIYCAWNKGLNFVKGEWVLFLGAGDIFFSTQTVEILSDLLNHVNPSTKFACGNIVLVNNSFKKNISGNISHGKWDLGLPELPPHPGVLHKFSVFDKNRKFDDSYLIAGDSKFMLEHLDVSNYEYIDLIVVNMAIGGISSNPSSWSDIKNEKTRIRDELGLKPPNLFYKLRDCKLVLKPILYILLGEKIKKIINLKNKLKI